MANKVLFLTLSTFSSAGGIEKVNRCLAKVLFNLFPGQVQLFSLVDGETDVDERYLPKNAFKGFSYQKANFIIKAIAEGVKSNTLILSHINLLMVAFLVKLFKPSVKVVVYAHGIEVWGKLANWKKRFLRKQVQIWAVSQYTANKLQETHQIPAQKITVLANSLAPFMEVPSHYQKPQTLLSKYQLQNNQPILYTLTRLSSKEMYKGYDLVLQALPQLLKKYPQLHYILAGKADDKEAQRVKNLIQSLHLEAHVTLAGFIPDNELTDHFLLADAFVMPSRGEGFGIVFIEATACGCPVIAGNKDGSVDALLNGKLGELIDPTDAEELEMAIGNLLAKPLSPAEKEQLQQQCLAHFGFERYQERVKGLLKEAEIETEVKTEAEI
jgi:phosphatidylinositol alpha-1,6-mannosyltransferase